MKIQTPRQPQARTIKLRPLNEQQQVRQQLLEMIRRNEALRRAKPR